MSLDRAIAFPSMFSITFADEPAFPWEGDGPSHRYAEVVLGNFKERFAVPLDYWSEQDYERQWRAGVERLVAGAVTSCLVTRMDEPADDQFVRFWALYRREGRDVVVQEWLWLPERGRVDPSAVYQMVDAYPEESDREDVSEWFLTIEDFEQFLAK